MDTCERLKHHLLKHGRESVQHQFEAHLDDCDHCHLLLQSWDRIPGLLDILPEHQPDPALVQRTLEAIEAKETNSSSNNYPTPRMATSLASIVVVLAVMGLSRDMLDNEYPSLMIPATKEEYEVTSRIGYEEFKQYAEPRDLQREMNGSDVGKNGRNAPGETGAHTTDMDNGFVITDRPEEAGALNLRRDREPEDENRIVVVTKRESLRKNSLSKSDNLVAESDLLNDSEPPQQSATPETAAETAKLAGALQKNKGSADKKTASNTTFGNQSGSRNSGEQNSKERGKQNREHFVSDNFMANPVTESESVEEDSQYFYADEISRSRDERDRAQIPHDPDTGFSQYIIGGQSSLVSESNLKSREIANTRLTTGPGNQLIDGFDFQSYFQAIEQLKFQPAEGYWANNYIPGDPNIRLLKTRLSNWDRSGLGYELLLDQHVRPVSQPFDAPADNALALSLMSDANAVDGATRMRIQVGIRGIEHRRGQRPAMNMGVVIDLPAEVDDSTRIAARALLDAVLASKQAGDRFSLVINGPGGLVVPADEFRFGPLQLARRAIIGNGAPDTGKDRDLATAIRKVSTLVRQGDDPGQPLGSSSILLISADTLEDADTLTGQIHEQAKDGITLSVIPLGNQPQASRVEQLVLAGLGNRRILQSPDQARQLIETELHTSSRAVARAARLSIHLASGVHLIGVVGSERLDAKKSRRVREIENSMDHRLSANLGIAADRGEDENGIQIVIPSIFAGDDVTVLLDVLVEKPGDIATVSLRYKDLVYLQNGSLRGQLSLPSGPLLRGPAEHSVLKNLLARHFSSAVGRAADALGRQQPAEAAIVLRALREQITALRNRITEFNKDPDLLRDEQILESYITLLTSPGAGTWQPELADSLRYAAWAKTHRPPAEWK